MDSSPQINPFAIPAESWKEILAHNAKSDLAQASRVNSQLLEVSRVLLYYQMFVWDDAHLSPIFPALRNADNARRLNHVVLDLSYGYEDASYLEELLEILRNSPVIRLDIVSINGIEYSPSDWMHELLVQFVQLPQNIPRKDVTTNSGSKSLPFLNTLRIANSAGSWEELLDYVDISRMKRLALWDYEQEMGDLANSWGKLVTASALTLESLSLWPSPDLLDQDMPTYLRSLAGFSKLHTITLFFTIEYRHPNTF
ncbi:hypothetical protein DL96DRAFT_1557462 [Flagelloscypha sp. PMI_526]|nr:hypothetical protein DL96DRAFT_1557462 [Flagelloscypha sp. PMI_526]